VSTARQEKPNIIVLDISFPPDVGSSGLQWDGFSIMEWMRRFKEGGRHPRHHHTSSDPANTKSGRLAAGAGGFLPEANRTTKKFSPRSKKSSGKPPG